MQTDALAPLDAQLVDLARSSVAAASVPSHRVEAEVTALAGAMRAMAAEACDAGIPENEQIRGARATAETHGRLLALAYAPAA